MADLLPAERIALTVAQAQLGRGENPPVNITAALAMTLERLTTPPPEDVRPREGEPGWSDVTCGNCGEEFGTNFVDDEIYCPECEARRCPHCHTWFGAET